MKLVSLDLYGQYPFEILDLLRHMESTQAKLSSFKNMNGVSPILRQSWLVK